MMLTARRFIQRQIWVDSETFYWEGFPDEEDLPVDFEIEYIRVWQKRPVIDGVDAPRQERELSNAQEDLP